MHEPDRRWLRLWARLGGSEELARAGWHDLVARYSEPMRAYHTLAHVFECQRGLEACKELAQDLDAVEAALWFHDVVYDPKRPGNEEASAMVARKTLEEANLALARIANVEDLILATRHDAAERRGDSALIVDIDLAILGGPAEVFDEYERKIRIEYAWVPEPVFRAKRASLLVGFLERPSVYLTDTFRESLEPQARINLARSIARLRLF